MIKQVQSVFKIHFYLLIVFIASACSLQNMIESPDTAITWHVPVVVDVPADLQHRVLMFWTYNYRREWLKCYEMEAPEVQDGISKELYHAYYNGGWKNLGVVVNNVEFSNAEKTKARVFTSTTYKRPGSTKLTKTMNLISDWKQVRGQWYHVFRDPIIKLRKGRG